MANNKPNHSKDAGSSPARPKRRGLTARGKGASAYRERIMPRMLIGRNSEIPRLRIFPVALVILATIPLLVGAFFLWANQNPTENLSDMKVAVVNNDRPAEKDGQPVNVGPEIIQNVKANPTFDWQFPSESEARKGLEDGKYFATVVIPQDFSSSVASIGTGNPHRAVLNFDYNDANGKSASVLLKAAAERLHSTINESITNTASAKVFSSLNEIHEGMGKAADGSGQLANGAKTANSGATQLDNGASKLLNGSSQLKDGAGTLTSKLGEAHAGAKKLDDGSAQLQAGAQQLTDKLGLAHEKSTELVSGAQQVADGNAKLAQGNAQLAAGLDEMKGKLAAIEGIPGINQLPQVRQLLDGVNQANSAAHQLADGAQKASDGSRRVADGSTQISGALQQFQDGSQTIASKLGEAHAGAGQLSNGLSQLQGGASRLQDGATTLNNGQKDLKNGTTQLAGGTGKLSEGAGTLHDSLASSQDRVPAFTTQMVAHNADTMAGPSELNESWVHKVSSMGEGLAPFLAGFGIFLGGLFVWQVVRPLPRRNLAASVSSLRLAIRTTTPALLISVLQVALLVGISWFTLDIRPRNLLAWTALMLLGGFGFLIFQQALIIWFGEGKGQLLGIVALVVQLASAGGLYPIETSPKFFQILHPFMPLSWLIEGMRQAGVGELNAQFWNSALVLAFVAVLTMVFLVWGVSRKRVYTMSTLHPAVV